MRTIAMLFAITAVSRVTGDVFYKYPMQGYHLAEKVKYYPHPEVPYVPVHPQYLYKHAPEYYHSDGKVEAEKYHGDDVLNKSVHDVQQSAIKAVHGDEGGHKVHVDTVGKHGYGNGETARKSSDEGVVAIGKSKEYDTASTAGYGEKVHGGFKKSHKTTGFHKSYHKEESGKDHEYVDEDHKAGEEILGKSYGNLFGEAGREGYAQANGEAGHKYLALGRAGESSGLKSAAAHGSSYGHHGSEDYLQGQALGRRQGTAGAYLRGAGGHGYALYEPIY